MNFKLLIKINLIPIKLRFFSNRRLFLFREIKAPTGLYNQIMREANRPDFYPTNCNSIASRHFMLFGKSFLNSEEEHARKIGFMK